MNELIENLLEDENGLFKPFSEEEYVKHLIRNCTRNSDGTYSCKGNVNLTGLGLKKIPVKFKRVEESFYCMENELEDLEGAPEYVGKDFFCAFNKLKTLEGGPKYVGGHYFCSHNELTTLEGAPEYVGKFFSCVHNKLRTLEGAPEYVGEGFFCHSNPVPERELKKTVDRDYLER